MEQDQELLRKLMKEAVQEILEAEMEEALQAGKGERKEGRLGYRSGYYMRSLVTRVGKLELRVPQDREGHFRTEVFERYQRSEKALVASLMEMYIQGVSTRKVKAITEELCGHQFSASTISGMVKKLDEELRQFAERRLEEAYPYLILDARYEKVREAGTVRSQAVLVAIGINQDGRRCVLAVDLANRESVSSWKDLLLRLRQRGLQGVEFVVSDDHSGLRAAIAEVLSEAVWQRCYVHFLRNALDYLPRKGDDDCLTELRWLYDRRDLEEARRDLALWLGKWSSRYPKLCSWVEDNIESTLELLPSAAGASQASQVHQHAGKADGRTETAHPGSANLSQCGVLFAIDSGARCRDPRELDRGHPLSQHGTPGGNEEREITDGGSLRLVRGWQGQGAQAPPLPLHPIPAKRSA
jgi:putative transposase